MTKTPTWLPRCPNHGEPLYGMPFPLPSQGVGKCPVSHCDFEFTAETDEGKVVKNADGSMSKAVGWKLSGHD